MVALGATAARELFGPHFRVTRQHGELLPDGPAEISIGTIHPSAIIRSREADRDRLRQLMAKDLTVVLAEMG